MVEQKQDICINRYNARHFEKLGYIIKRDKDKRGRDTIMPQHIYVDINDIPKSSKIKIKITCDYCGELFEESVVNYHEGHKIINTDCCSRCIKYKILDSKMEKYNSINPFEISQITGTHAGRNKKYQKDDIITKCKNKQYTIISELPEYPILSDRVILQCNLHNCQFESSIGQLMKDVDNCSVCYSVQQSKLTSKSNILIAK